MASRAIFMNKLQDWLEAGLKEKNGKVPPEITAAYRGKEIPDLTDENSRDHWCAETIVAAAFYAGARGNNMIPVTARCCTMGNKSYNAGTFHAKSEVSDGTFVPGYGDIFVNIYDTKSVPGVRIPGKLDGNGHVGAVISYDSSAKKVITIEGNVSDWDDDGKKKVDRIVKGSQKLSNVNLVGFIRPQWDSADQPTPMIKTSQPTTTIKASPAARKNNVMSGDLSVWCAGTQLAMSGYIIDSLKTDYVYTADLYLADSKGNNLQYIGYKLCNEFLEGLEAYGGGKHKFELVWDYDRLSKYGNGNYYIKMYGRNPDTAGNKLIIQKRINITCKTGQASQVSAVEGEYYPIYLGNSISIWDALESLGIDGTYAHRKLIAVANAIEGYRGTAEQNTYMLSLLKEGKLIKEVK